MRKGHCLNNDLFFYFKVWVVVLAQIHWEVRVVLQAVYRHKVRRHPLYHTQAPVLVTTFMEDQFLEDQRSDRADITVKVLL